MSRARRERARQRHGANWRGMNEIIALVRVQHGQDGSHCFWVHFDKVEKHLLRNGLFTLAFDLIWISRKFATSIPQRFFSQKKRSKQKYHTDRLVMSRWSRCFYCPVLSTAGIVRQMQSFRRFYFCTDLLSSGSRRFPSVPIVVLP